MPASERCTKLRDALELWRGPPLEEFGYEAFAQSEIARLEELRLTLLEERIDAEIEVGAAREAHRRARGSRRRAPAPGAASGSS